MDVSGFASPNTKKGGGVHCIAPGCTNYFYKGGKQHFHRLPLKNKALLKSWLQKIKRKDPPVNEYARVCSDHLSRNAIAKNVRLTAPVPSSATQPRTCVPTQSPQYLIWLRFRAECAMLLRVPATSRRAVSENEDLPSGHVNNNTRRWVCLPASYLPNTGSISKATRCTQLCFGLVLFLI